jgi:hypothetical protein
MQSLSVVFASGSVGVYRWYRVSSIYYRTRDWEKEMKTKKRRTVFSTEQKLKELHEYRETLLPPRDLDLIFMDLSTPRRDKSVDGDDPSMDLMERITLEDR